MSSVFPSCGRSSSAKSGFLLPSILVLLTILFLMAMTRSFFSRQRLNMAGHLRDYELAYQMAASGMTVGVALFNQAMDFLNNSNPATFPKRDKAPPAIKQIIQALLDEQGLPYPQGASLIVDQNFVNEYFKEAPEARGVQLTMEMRHKESLFQAVADPGFQIDEREISYDFFINTVGNYGASSVRVTTFFEGRFVNILPPVLGKFSLFLLEQPAGGVNLLIDSKTKTLINNAPLTVTSGERAAPYTLAPSQVTPLLDKQGWIFLGGLSPWKLGMSQGGDLPELSECFLQSALFLYQMPAGQVLSKSGVSYCSQQGRLFKELIEDPGKVMILKEPSVETTQTSLLHLFGSTKNPSPTLVFGNVKRRWMMTQGLKRDVDADPIIFPYLDQGTFASSKWPGDEGIPAVSQTIKQHFNNSYEAYSKRMSDIWEEDINSSNLYALKMDKTEASPILVLSADNLPSSFSGCRLSQRMQVNNSPANFFKMNSGSVYELKNSYGKLLFSGGDLARIDYRGFLEKKAGYKFENEQEFWEKIPRDAGNKIHLGGIILIKGNLTIPKSVVISATGGGMLLCTENIRIKAPVQCSGDQPLTIISLSKEIWVETTGQIDAALIAISGQIHLPKDGVINGLVAAKSLDLPVGSWNLKREINYQTRFDPTDAENYLKNYRMMISGKRYSFVH
ncbi:MAG: hypothetical protein WA705_22450 [Candidatus Ozemobacteraceae bacterium]